MCEHEWVTLLEDCVECGKLLMYEECLECGELTECVCPVCGTEDEQTKKHMEDAWNKYCEETPENERDVKGVWLYYNMVRGWKT